VCFAKVVGLGDIHAHEHDEGEDHDHHHAVDPHLWLDPTLVQRLIVTLKTEIATSQQAIAGSDDPAEAARTTDAATRLLSRIAEVDSAYRARLAPFAGASLVTHHNAFSRLADRYGLRIAAVIRPVEDAEPTPAQIATAVDAVRKQGARAVFVEPQFDARTAERIAAEAGVKVGTLDPEGIADWFVLMEENLAELERLLAPGE
jgi:zinc transport system substrate-binding protein